MMIKDGGTQSVRYPWAWVRVQAMFGVLTLFLLLAACGGSIPAATPAAATRATATPAAAGVAANTPAPTSAIGEANQATSTALPAPTAAEPTATQEPKDIEGPPPASPTAAPPVSTDTASPSPAAPEPTPEPAPVEPVPVLEAAVTLLPLSSPLTNPNAEVSGMALYGDHLIIMPQYPSRFSSDGDGSLFSLPLSEIVAYLDGSSEEPLQPQPLPFLAPGLSTAISGFEGYEAIAFDGDTVYLTIEASTGDGMRGYLVTGQISPDLSALKLDTSTWAEIIPQANLSNMTDETLLVDGERLLTIYEANGANVNASPVAHLFDTDLSAGGAIPFPIIEYRITDATGMDADRRFWAINYFYPGDTKLQPAPDQVAIQFGQGPTHAALEPVERLVLFQVSDSAITLVDTPPIQLELLPDDARNWEGLVRLEGRGFLLMTDKFPETLLGFVPLDIR